MGTGEEDSEGGVGEGGVGEGGVGIMTGGGGRYLFF